VKSERLVVLMTPEDKRALTNRAKALDVSVAELLRRVARGESSGPDEATLAKLAKELHKSVKESRAALRLALADSEATLLQLRGHRKSKQEA